MMLVSNATLSLALLSMNSKILLGVGMELLVFLYQFTTATPLKSHSQQISSMRAVECNSKKRRNRRRSRGSNTRKKCRRPRTRRSKRRRKKKRSKRRRSKA